MQEVGHHLQVEAFSREASDGRDLFARSSYNRYYYAVYLHVRELLESINPSWAKQPHKGYPEVLRGKVKRKISKTKKVARKTGDRELVQACERANSFAHNLAQLMEDANKVRVIADYNPQVPVEFVDALRFRLIDIEITDAHSWLQKASIWTRSIKDTIRQTNV